MGPLSAIAVSFWLVLYGLTAIAWITASLHALGVVAIIATIVILVDVFWVNSGRHYSAWRDR
jgi:hypothetical protein